MAQFSPLKLVILVLGLGFFVYVLGPPLYWHFVGDQAGRLMSACPECNECPDEAEYKAYKELRNATLPACPKVDDEMADEQQKSKYKKLQEEMNLQKSVFEDDLQKSHAAFLDMKKTSSSFQKELEKCTSGMESSEGARENVVKERDQLKKTALLWESRAKSLGWKTDQLEATTTADIDGEDEEESATTTREAKEVRTETQAEEKAIPTSKNGPAITRELKQSLEVASYIVERAVQNEFGGLKDSRQRATDMNLL